MLQTEDQNALSHEQISRPQTKQSAKGVANSQRSRTTFGEDITNNKKEDYAGGFTLQKVSEPTQSFAAAPISTRATERPDQAQFKQSAPIHCTAQSPPAFNESKQAQIRQLFRERLEKE